MNDTAQASELVEIAFDVNGTERRLVVDPSRSLVDVLRRDLGLTGAHVSCEIGVCGVCTLVMNDEPVRACLVLAVQADGGSVRTVEGLAQDGELTSLQEAFREAHGLQCGFCTPGFLMLLSWYLERLDRTPDDDEIREIVSSNLCRCTGYQGIVDAVRLAVSTRTTLAADGSAGT